MRFKLVLAYIVFGGLLLPRVTYADDDAQKTEQALSDVRGQIKTITSRIHTHKTQYDKTRKNLRTVERKLSKAQRKKRNTERAIQKNKKNQKRLKQQKNDTLLLIEQQKRTLSEHLRAAYMMGDQAQIKLLLNQDDASRLSRMRQYFERINRARTSHIGALNSNIIELEEIKQNIEENTLVLDSLLAEQKQNVTIIKAQHKQRETVLSSIKKQLAKEGVKLRELEKNERNLSQLLSKLNDIFKDIPDSIEANQPFRSLKGKLPWPVRGTIKNNFGSTKQHGDLKWNGLLLNTQTGNQVSAVAAGQVVFADWLQGFGQLMIIDHNDGFLTLYGHNQDLLKDVGDWVQQNERVALAGNSGGIDKTALYFEIRHNGKPVNPNLWCRK